MSQRVWLVSVLAAALGVVGITVERSHSQYSTQEDPQPQAEARGEFGGRSSGEFGGGTGFGRGGGMAAEAPQPTSLPAPAVPRLWVTDDLERTEQLYAILKSPLPSAGLNFPDGTPLEEITTFLSEEYDIPIVLDTNALDGLGIGPDEPVAINVANVRLDQAMRRMLQPLGLTCIVVDGVLMVTSEEAALTKLDLAIYDVRDLVLKGDYDSLIGTITGVIATDTWAKNGGGQADIRPYPQRGVLVISQTQSGHESIAALLAAMRKMPTDPSAKPFMSSPAGGAYFGGHPQMNRQQPERANILEGRARALEERNRTNQQRVQAPASRAKSSEGSDPFGGS